jgi:hypothetical protein
VLSCKLVQSGPNVCGAFLCGQMHAHCNFTSFTSYHPSQPSLPDHPFLVLASGLAGPSLLVLVCLATVLAICRWLSPVCTRGRVLRSASGFRRLGDHHAISITRSRDERCKTEILGATTNAFDVRGQLDGQFLSTLARRILGDMSQHEDKYHDGLGILDHRWRLSKHRQSCCPFHLHPPSLF